MAVIDIAIDMGSTYTTIFKKGSGIVLREPTAVCLQKTTKGSKVKEVGIKAKKMQGRTGVNTAIVFPVVEGVIKNVDLCIEMLSQFLAKIIPNTLFRPKIRAVVTVPCGLNAEEIADYEKVMYGVNIGRIYLVPAILASAIGDDLKTSQPRGSLVVNIGGGKTEIAVISLDSIVNGCMLSVGGKLMDTSIAEYVKDLFDINISEATAEKIKQEVASLYENDRSSIEFSGADISSSRPVTEIVNAQQISIAVSTFYDDIIKAINGIINSCKPDIVADITETGIIVSGGGSQITGLENYFRKNLNLSVKVPDSAINSVILGAGKLISDEFLLEKVMREN